MPQKNMLNILPSISHSSNQNFLDSKKKKTMPKKTQDRFQKKTDIEAES